MAKKDVANNTDLLASGECTFVITTANEVLLKSLSKYSMMLDFITGAGDEELLNVDGLINSILEEGMTRRIKDLVKKHSFEDAQEFIDCMASCEGGEDVSKEIASHEKNFYQKSHDEILSHIPMDDGQKVIQFS